jgi:hypothetical protein
MNGVFSHMRQVPDILVGAAGAVVIGGLGWLAVVGVERQDAGASIRGFGTLLTVFFGLISAVWWNQSAKLSNRLIDQNPSPPQMQKDANILNGAAATFTALTLLPASSRVRRGNREAACFAVLAFCCS